LYFRPHPWLNQQEITVRKQTKNETPNTSRKRFENNLGQKQDGWLRAGAGPAEGGEGGGPTQAGQEIVSFFQAGRNEKREPIWGQAWLGWALKLIDNTHLICKPVFFLRLINF
jgi:hypothetical protein